MVKLLHWNILFEESAENIFSLVKQINPDIFCCQEINDKTGLIQMIAGLLPNYYYKPADIKGAKGDELNLGNAIFSKFPIKSSHQVALWDGPNPTSGNVSEKRIYVEATLDIDGTDFTVGTTHLSFAPAFSDTPDRLEQAKNLMQAIDGHRSNFALTGDFNSAPDLQIVKQMEAKFKSAGPSHDQPTFTTIPFSFLGFDVKGLEWRVDYIFTSPDVKVSDSSIINTKFSDHLPIVAELQI